MQLRSSGYDPVTVGLTATHWVGPDEVVALCPFHSDSHPSLCFNVRKGKFICFSCGERGDARKLAARAGGHAAKSWLQAPDPSREIEWLHLGQEPLAYDHPYLVKRGVTNGQVERYHIRKHQLGIIVPLTNPRGQVVGVLLRKRFGEVRYLTLGEKPPLWPLGELRELRRGRTALVEGVFGVLCADRAEVPAMATLGAGVKSAAGQYLADMNLVVVFDNDQAGYQGAGRVLKMSPLSKVLIPGTEADELSSGEWHDIMGGRLSTTTSLTLLAIRHGDKRKFYRGLP